MQENMQLVIPTLAGVRTPMTYSPEWAPFDIGATVLTWLTSEVANGDLREDSVSSYKSNLAHWSKWCEVNRVNQGAPSGTA